MDLQMGSNQPISRRPVKQQDVPQVNINSRELVTRFQLESLLQVMGMMSSALGHFYHSSAQEDGGVPKDTPRIPEALIAVENTLQNACERLDEIIKDHDRWDLSFQLEVERKYKAAQALQMEVLKNQNKVAIEVISPHFRYRPTILRGVDGSWVAFLGNMDEMDQGVLGVGETAQDAMEAFDDAFRGVTNPKVLAWLEQREQNAETGALDAPFPRNKNINEHLDPGTNQDPSSTSSGGKDAQPDSPNLGL